MEEGELCSCGCGCRCDNAAVVAPAGTPDELRYSRIGRIYNGTAADPIFEVDVVVTNQTEYVPWRSYDNGHFTPPSPLGLDENDVGIFGQISLLEGTSTTFRYSFVRPGTQTLQRIDYGFEFCFFDLDTGPQTEEGAVPIMQETIEACGLDDSRATNGYFMHGKLPQESPLLPYLCDNINTEDYLEVSAANDCVTAKGLKEGTGVDNPADWDQVLLNTASDPIFSGDYKATCADYDKCPPSGISGFARPPGINPDIKVCADGEEATAMGVYPGNPDSTPMRYTMPKFICVSYPPGRTHFEVTWQTVYAQGLQATGLLYASLGSVDAVGVVSTESGELFASHSRVQPYAPLPCAPTLSVITHAYPGTTEFWAKWEQAARSAAEEFTVRWNSTGYDPTAHAAAIEEACALSNAIVVTVPYQSNAGYEEVHAAIESCLDQRPTVPIVTANTDGYHNPRILSYVGPHNFVMGRQCGLAPMGSGTSQLSGSAAPGEMPEDLASVLRVLVYQSPGEISNSGIASRYEGISHRSSAMGVESARYTSADDIRSEAAAASHPFVIALGNGAFGELQEAGVAVDFVCGDNLEPSVPHYGQDVWSQGAGAVLQAIVATRGPWLGAIGNAMQGTHQSGALPSEKYKEFVDGSSGASGGVDDDESSGGGGGGDDDDWGLFDDDDTDLAVALGVGLGVAVPLTILLVYLLVRRARVMRSQPPDILMVRSAGTAEP